MALVPKAEDVCNRHSKQWQMYKASGCSSGVVNWTAPHWHRQSIVALIGATGAWSERCVEEGLDRHVFLILILPE